MRVSLTTILDIVGLVLVLFAAFVFTWVAGVGVIGVLVLLLSRELAKAEPKNGDSL